MAWQAGITWGGKKSSLVNSCSPCTSTCMQWPDYTYIWMNERVRIVETQQTRKAWQAPGEPGYSCMALAWVLLAIAAETLKVYILQSGVELEYTTEAFSATQKIIFRTCSIKAGRSIAGRIILSMFVSCLRTVVQREFYPWLRGIDRSMRVYTIDIKLRSKQQDRRRGVEEQLIDTWLIEQLTDQNQTHAGPHKGPSTRQV